MPRRSKGLWAGLILLALVSLLGCRAAPETSSLSDRDLPQGWAVEGKGEVYTADNLYDLVNGQADSFFAYGFQRATVYTLRSAEGMVVIVEVWELDEPINAYGLYTASVAGEPIALGQDGDADPGRRIFYWQDRYAVQILSRQHLPAESLLALGEAISDGLPSGGERPALLARLPEAHRDGRPALFFHSEISLQSELWLGGENLLGLSPDTDGVWAGYRREDLVYHLLLIQYDDADVAAEALAVLQGTPPEGLIVAEVAGELLGAVFGEVGQDAAVDLLREALS
jgi:hypothetical protein